MFFRGDVLITFVTVNELKRLVKLSTKHFVAEGKSKEEKQLLLSECIVQAFSWYNW